MLTRWPPLLLLLLVATTTRVHAAFVEGECYKDDIINPHVTVSGGNFDPESLIPDTCKDFCGRLNFQYAAADEGKYCYCLQDLGTLILESGSCTEYCSDGSACGGPTPGLLTVWTTSVLSGKLKIVLDATAPYMFKVGSTVDINVTTTGAWVTDWGDGSGRVLNGSQHTYTISGEFVITAYLEILPHLNTGAMVMIIEAPNATLECPHNVTAGMIGTCTAITYSQGFDTFLTSSFNSPGYPNNTYHIPGERTHVYGSIMKTEWNGYLVPSGAVIIHSEGIKANGYLARINLMVYLTGWVVIYAVTPGCSSGVYCSGTGLCHADCSPNYFTQTCATSLCVSAAKCSVSSCAAGGTPPSTTEYQYRLLYSFFADVQSVPIVHLLDTTLVEVYEGEMLAVGCLQDGDCQSNSPTIYTRNMDMYEDPGIVVTFTATSLATWGTNITEKLLVSVEVREHEVVGIDFEIECLTASSIPTGDVPTPYTADTAQYSLIGDYDLIYTITSDLLGGVSAWTSTASVICQEIITAPVLVAELWVPLLINTSFVISFNQGAPVFSEVNIGPEVKYTYYDNATNIDWDVNLYYTATGTYNLTGNASNLVSWVLYTSLVHVVPVLTDSWQATTNCPCLNVSQGFNLSIDLPEAPNPPFTANITATYSSGDLFPAQSLDFGTSAGGGVAEALGEMFHTIILVPGNYTLTFVLRNEVSNATFTTWVLVEEGLADVVGTPRFILDGILTEGMGENKNSFMYNTTIYFLPSALRGLPSVERWNLTLSTGEVLDITDTASENLTYVFVEEGTHTLLVSGCNTVQGCISSDPIIVVILTDLEGFELHDDGSIIEPNITKIINATFTVLPPVSCVLATYGDNSPYETYGYEKMCSEKYPNATYMGGHSNPLILKHTYREEGIYMVRAVASDSKVSKTNDLQVVIASLPCNMPVVTIVKKMMDYTNAPKNWRSLSYVQSATAQINCSHSVPVRYGGIFSFINLVYNLNTGITFCILIVKYLVSRR